ncbi:hypothetical protein Q1695_006642 [Nippostrongylus brasiliensis]|nr:hypothetical protein Q1695_006642 [Nippostrongylus brasiliensis]
MQRTITVSVIGVSGREAVKGSKGVGKSLICNRFVRGDFDNFFTEHCSVLSQTDFGGSPVINNDHWLYWGERQINLDESSGSVTIRVIEQTEFLDDETYEPIAGPSTSEPYAKRCCQIRLESRDKLMYIQKEQLGLEAEFDQHVLPDGKCSVDAFIFVFDASRTEGRTFESQCSSSSATLSNVIKTKKPIVLALSQMDSADDEARKALSSLLSRKDLKSTHITVVEVSALMNVNIDELFVVTACAALRSKLRLKVLPFSEAAKIVSDRNRDVQLAYTRLLQAMLPVESWPSVRLSWSRLMSERCLERQPDYCNFLRIYGEATAKKIYDSHVNEAREHWMAARLRALLPNLPRVFATLLDKTDVAQLSWSSANHLIHSHPLFDEFFQPLGQLGKQLDPLPADNERRMSQSTLIDQRIPAEILLRHEARQAFEAYKQALQTEQRKERLEEEFEFLLSDTPQVTPGKPLQDVSIFLQGYPAYDALPPSQAAMVYDRFQHDLLKRAEMEFRECLLENIEMFVDVVRSCREEFGSDAFPVPESEMLRIKDFLQDDFRYRQLSRLFELRDSLVRSFIMFLAQPGIHECPSFNGCAQLAIHEAIALFFQKKRMHKFSTSHVVDIAVHGEMAMVAQFITDMNVLLRNEPFATNYGPTTIRCYGADEVADEKSCDRTQLFLLDSVNSLDYAREYSKKGALASSTGTLGAADPLPPVYVLVCDPSHYDLLPYLHQQGIHLAESTYGIFIGAGSGDSDGGWSRASDCSSIFGRDQLLRICDTVCASQLDRRSGLRIQVSVLCGDPIPLDTMLVTMLGVEGQTLRAIRDPNQNGAGVVPVDVFWSGQRFAVDLHLGAYHSWLASKSKSSTHGHVVVYSARRAASFAHARAAISRVLDDGCRTLTGKAILLVAVAELQDYFSDEETNLLLTEGSELATSIGASFITIPPDASSQQSAELARFFERVRAMVPKTSTSERPMKKNSDFLNSDEYHHTGLRKDSSSMYGTYRTSHSAATLLSDSSASAESILSTSRMERVASAASAPALRNSISTISIGQNSAASRPRRRVAPLTSPLRLPIPNNISPACAPLATPEMIDIAPEYSLVQDALVDDEHIYATLDFSTKPSPKTNSSKEEKSASTKKEKKRPLRSRMFTNHSSTEPSTSPSTAPSQPSSAGSSMHREDIVTRKAPHQTNAEWRWLPISPNNHERRPKTAPLKPRVAPKPTNIPNPTMVCSMPPRSVTMDIINRESVVKARQILAHGALKKPGLRQSLSVESFVDLMGEKKKKFRFVRKVATSFRFKKPVDKEQPIEKTSQAAPPITSRSLPQSPQVERKPRKTAYLASSEKTSNAFSWLPSRSPKRTHKSTSEIFQGVVGPNDTLQTMAERDGGLPLFLTRCVDFIEKEGGLEMEGLYRVPGNQAQLSELEKVFREKGDVDIASLDMPVHVVATAVKSFFSCLTEPLIPTELHDDILGCLNGSEETVERLHGVMSRLSPVNRKVLVYFTTHLEKVASSPSTAMDVHNLSKVLFPTLFRPQFNDFVEMSTGTAKFQLATEVILQNAHEIFNTYQAQSIRV